MVALYLVGGKAEAVRFLDRIRLIKRAASLGGVHSLACHPCSLTHVMLTMAEQEATGITPNLIRLSVGIESVNDIIADLKQALE